MSATETGNNSLHESGDGTPAISDTAPADPNVEEYLENSPSSHNSPKFDSTPQTPPRFESQNQLPKQSHAKTRPGGDEGEGKGDAVTIESLIHNIERVQATLRRLLANPDLTQHNTFYFCAPLCAFLCLLGLGVSIPHFPACEAWISSKTTQGWEFALVPLAVSVFAVLVAVGLGLGVLRMAIWGVACVAHAFAFLDVKDKLGIDKIKAEDQERRKLSQAELIFGFLFRSSSSG